MSEDITTEETMAEEVDDAQSPATEHERRQLHEIWAAGTGNSTRRKKRP